MIDYTEFNKLAKRCDKAVTELIEAYLSLEKLIEIPPFIDVGDDDRFLEEIKFALEAIRTSLAEAENERI